MKIFASDKKQRGPGDFFKEITGQSADQCESLLDVEKAVEKKLHRKLEFKYFNSSVVPRRGDVFPRRAPQDSAEVDAKIDAYLR